MSTTLTTYRNGTTNGPEYTVGHVGWSPIDRVARQLPALFNDSWLDGLFDGIDRAFDVPGAHYPYDVRALYNKDGEISRYQIDVALAGIGKDNIGIKVRDGSLIISVDKEQSENEEHIKYARKGISKRKTSMSFHLAENVDVKSITSEYKDGLLRVSVPVRQPEVQNIDIKVD
jgi:HSP20 family protein